MKNINLSKVKTYSINKRQGRVRKGDFASVCKKGCGFSHFYKSLPNILAASEFKALVSAIVKAKKSAKPVIFMMGAHVIKCGLSPLIIDLINKDIITAVAFNGAGIIHDTEIAMAGFTSEDVGEALKDGSFGMAKETADFINRATREAALKNIGLGKAVGHAINKAGLKYKASSILAAADKKGISATAHVAIGADIVHQHPSCDGANLGKASLRDFHIFIGEVAGLASGGVAINIGSAVILPEGFLKALNTARNLGKDVKNFTTANFDMIAQYRPHQNVLKRPVSSGGRAISITGHHEIMIPLLYQAIIENI